MSVKIKTCELEVSAGFFSQCVD